MEQESQPKASLTKEQIEEKVKKLARATAAGFGPLSTNLRSLGPEITNSNVQVNLRPSVLAHASAEPPFPDL